MKSKTWFVCLKNIVLASLVSFGIYLASAMFLAAIFENSSRTLLDIVCYVFMAVFYIVFFYRFHMYNRLDTYAEHTEKFNPKAEIKAFLRGDGKVILLIYGLCAVATEIDYLIPRETAGRPVVAVCSFCLTALSSYIPVPVLRSAVCFALASAVACLLAVIRSRKVYLEKSKANSERRG